MDIVGFQVPTWAVLTLACIVGAYWYFTQTFDFFTKRGIPGPKPWPVFGNALRLFKYGTPGNQKILINEYGKIVGCFMGRMPNLLIADLDILKHVMIKDFPNFINRPTSPVGIERPYDKMMSSVKGDDWRRIRNLLSPGFSTGKLRMMMKPMNECGDTLVQNLQEAMAKSGGAIKVKDYVGGFTMDVIAATAFGIKLNSQKDPDDPFTKHAQLFFAFRKITLFMTLITPFGRLCRNVFDVPIMDPAATAFMTNVCEKLMKERQEKTLDQPDFLQLMMNAHKMEEKGNDVEADGKAKADDTEQQKPHKAMTTEEIIAQMVLFFLAGYETTANSIGFLLYNLATHPEIQQRAAQEVDEVMGSGTTVTADMVNEMPYLDMCIQENLRLYPPTCRIQRVTDHTITIKGLTIPAGTVVVAPLGFLHFDPSVWPDPDKFDPERFTPEAKASRHPMQYMPFGEGPRNCIGERMALIEVKVAMSKLLHRFRFEVCEETEVPLKVRKVGLAAPIKPLHLKLVERSQ